MPSMGPDHALVRKLSIFSSLHMVVIVDITGSSMNSLGSVCAWSAAEKYRSDAFMLCSAAQRRFQIPQMPLGLRIACLSHRLIQSGREVVEPSAYRCLHFSRVVIIRAEL